MFIAPSHYDLLAQKGVAPLLLERDEGGFFRWVVSVCPWAPLYRVLTLGENHIMVEIGFNKYFGIFNTKVMWMLTLPLQMAVTVKTLVTLVKRESIDLIRATDPFGCGFYAWVVSSLIGIPFCISIHADYEKRFKLLGRKTGIPFLFRVCERFVLPRADLVMPIREHMKEEMIKIGVDSKKIRIIPHGIDIQEFACPDKEEIKKKFEILPGKKVISFVGRLAKDNYVYDVIELARRLSKTRDDFIIILVGDGVERKKLEILAEEYELSSLVIFTGFQTKDKVISIRLQSYLALCLMGGLSLIEACLAGCPAISYDVEWHHELVKSGETGFLIEENDLDGLVEAIVYLLSNPEEAKEMGTRARELAIARHNISNTSEIKKNCYRELLRDKTC